MAFNLPIGTDQTLDISQCASILNRRFYRQGINWAVAGFTFFTQGQGEITISKIWDSWVASNSWEKGFRAWQKMNNDALDEAESIRPRFLDFKVYMDSVHHAAGSGANLLPVDHLNNPATPGEWEYSQFVVPTFAAPGASKNREIIWTGGNYPGAGASGLDSVSLIEGYAASRGLPDVLAPNVPTDAFDADGNTPANWISAIFNEATDQTSDVLEDLIEENNIAPYPFENDGTATDTQYPGGANQLPGLQIHDALLVTATTVGGKSTAPGGNFQGGLVRISNTIDSGTIFMFVHLVPGPHRGYMCQPMTDV